MTEPTILEAAKQIDRLIAKAVAQETPRSALDYALAAQASANAIATTVRASIDLSDSKGEGHEVAQT